MFALIITECAKSNHQIDTFNDFSNDTQINQLKQHKFVCNIVIMKGSLSI